ncbi:MAG TPA: glycosyltransferase family 9 protein [Actinomycetota bacterium]|nr:glycosyltransferase family 9 protein [Actinomycetota bacterium]
MAWEAARRVLAVRLDAMGDVVMTGPAIRALAASGPGAPQGAGLNARGAPQGAGLNKGRTVTVLTSPGGAQAARLLPGVDEVICYEAPWMKASQPRPGSAARGMAARLRAGRFDAAVIFTVYSQSPLPAALLCHLADIPLRLAHCRENPYQLLTDWLPEREPALRRHEVRRQLDLVASLGCAVDDERLRLRIPETASRRVAALLADLGPGPVVAVHPGASAPSRRWPAEHFAALSRRLSGTGRCRIVFTGSAGERDLVESVRSAMGAPSCSLAGSLDLAALAALLSRCDLLVANNTGPVHVAAAVGTPVLDLYALTNPQHTPWMVPCRVLSHDVACRWCYKSVCPEGHHHCLRLVDADEAYVAACELLAAGGNAL